MDTAAPPLVLSATVVPDSRFRRKTFSVLAAYEPGARLVALLRNVSHLPEALKTGDNEAPLPASEPVLFMLASMVVSVTRSRTNTSVTRFTSRVVTRFVDQLVNATNLPSALITGSKE